MRIPVPLKVFLIIQLIHIIEDAKMIFAQRMALLLLIGYLLYYIILGVIEILKEEASADKLWNFIKKIGIIPGIWAIEEYIMFPLWILDTINWVSYILPFGNGLRCTPYYKNVGGAAVPTEYNGVGFKHVKNAPELFFMADSNVSNSDISSEPFLLDKISFYFDKLAIEEMKTESDARYFRKLIFGDGKLANIHWSENNIFMFVMTFLLSRLRKYNLNFTSTLSALSVVSILESVTYSYSGDFSDNDAFKFISNVFSIFISPKFYHNMVAILFRFVVKIILFIEDILNMIADAFRIIDTIKEMTIQTVEEASQMLANSITTGTSLAGIVPVVGSSILTV